MPSISLSQMREYLSRSIASFNLAPIDLKNHLSSIAFADRVARGGWIARVAGTKAFAQLTVAMFPEVIVAGQEYPLTRRPPIPTRESSTICATLHHSGIASYYCSAQPQTSSDPVGVEWHAQKLDVPSAAKYEPIGEAFEELNFVHRTRAYQNFKYSSDAAVIPDAAVPEEFSKEHLRVSFSDLYLSEISNIDGIFWGQRKAYLMQTREHVHEDSPDMGPFFGLHVGTFAKLAFYASKRGNLHSLYVVREIDNPHDRNLVNWLFITFDQLAQFASWIPQGGGQAMGGGQSSVVRIPRAEFRVLNAQSLASL